MDSNLGERATDSQWNVSITLDPPIVHSFLEEKERANTVLSCDLSADINERGSTELLVNWIFNRVGLEGSGARSSDRFFLATQGGELSLFLKGANLSACTESQQISFDHSVKKKKKRNSSLQVAPAVKCSTEGAKLELSGVKYLQNRSEEFEYVTNLTTSEQFLAVQKVNDGCTWDLLRPKTETAIRHYVFGNLYLEASFACDGESLSGVLRTQPNGIRVFDQTGEMIRNAASFGMLFKLWRRGILSVGSLGSEQRIEFLIERTANV